MAIAVTVAEAKLRPFTAAEPARRHLRARRYEIYMLGMDAHDLGLAFPDLATERAGSAVALYGRLDAGALDSTLRRLRALGCRICGYVEVRAATARP